jgi:hypothetical protein
MTIRSVILGILGAAFIAVVTYLNDHVWMLNQMVGSHLPVFVFGVLIVLVMLVNPLLNAVNPRWRLRPQELAVGLLMMLVVCSIPAYGLLGVYPKATAIANQMYATNVSWQNNQLAEIMPSHMLPADGQHNSEFANGFTGGLGKEGQPIGLDQVPWRFWETPLTFWMPMVILMAIAVICLGLILHRQWTTNERLRYPIAEIATSLMDQPAGRSTPSVFSTSVFWWGLGLILFIRLNNGIAVWTEGKWVAIPMQFDSFFAIVEKYPLFEKEQWHWLLFRPVMYPTAIAIAFLLAADVSFSLGIAPLAIMAVTLYLYKSHGEMIRVTEYMGGGPMVYQRFGSYLALMGVILYMGRRYYGQVLRRAFAFRQAEGVDPSAAWACRILLVAMILMVTMLVRSGLAWPFAIIVVLLILIAYVGMSRINCEGGLFLNLPRWQPSAIMLGGLGAAAMGPKAILIVSMLSVVFTVGIFECLMPFFMNGLRVCTNLQVKPARAGFSAVGIYVLGLAIAVPAVLWTCHNYGTNKEGYTWSTYELPQYFYYSADKAVTKLQEEVKLTESQQYTVAERVAPANWDTDKDFVKWVVIGIVLVGAVSFFRLRWHWWPLHPFMFMVWGTRQMAELSASFLVGWGIKSAVTNLGGTAAYRKTKNFMYGAIAGDLGAGLVFMAVRFYQCQIAGLSPEDTPALTIFPTIG